MEFPYSAVAVPGLPCPTRTDAPSFRCPGHTPPLCYTRGSVFIRQSLQHSHPVVFHQVSGRKTKLKSHTLPLSASEHHLMYIGCLRCNHTVQKPTRLHIRPNGFRWDCFGITYTVWEKIIYFIIFVYFKHVDTSLMYAWLPLDYMHLMFFIYNHQSTLSDTIPLLRCFDNLNTPKHYLSKFLHPAWCRKCSERPQDLFTSWRYVGYTAI